MDLNSLKIDILRKEDLDEIIKVFTFPWTTSEATKLKWDRYMSEQKANTRIVCLVKWQNKLVGYGSLLKNSEYPHFKDYQIPEIHDVWISEEYRGQGFGKLLICHLEWIAQKENYKFIGIGVGLYKDYGKAQKLYIQLGYVPDGNGVAYKYQETVPGNSYPLDDDLVIWLKKSLPTTFVEEDGFYIERQEESIQEGEDLLFDGICNDAAKKKGMERMKPFRIFLKSTNQAILGGANGITYYGCLYIDMLWINESIRNRGFGKKIVAEAEKIALERKCTFSTMNTMDWEALSFYEKLGYNIEFVREGYEKASKMYMLRKKL